MKKDAEILKNFGEACAKRPIDMIEVSRCRKEVLACGGESLVVEASTIVGSFVITTIAVDANGVKLPSAFSLVKAMKGMIRIMVKFMSWIKKDFK